MARHETDREDLMREAVALVRRAEFEVPGENDSVISGFRECGSLSVYFGADPVYHFDPEARLRRAFLGGLLYRTQGATLARLRRVRTDAATELHRHDLTEQELRAFLVEMQSRLQRFAAALETGRCRLLRQVPPDEPIVPALIGALNQILKAEQPLAPPIKGKR